MYFNKLIKLNVQMANNFDSDDNIDDLLDQGVSEDELRDNPETRDQMNDPDSPHYNG